MKAVYVVLFVLMTLGATAQFRKTIELKPISHRGFQYYYDLLRLRTPYALQVPLLSLEDNEVTRRYRNFERLDRVGDFLFVVPVVFLFSDLNDGGSGAAQTFFWLFIGSIGGDLILDLFANRQLRKGVDRYNQLIVAPASGSAGLSLRYVF
jgi:hypothetical protein